ncbi:MAG TPA: carboxypeptidase-like regulatory domain-containing protein [Planctomycetota bacterium]|nr:carboxypeptidase-like regulatory domain-containing protein [Planctomycetota bacterium]
MPHDRTRMLFGVMGALLAAARGGAWAPPPPGAPGTELAVRVMDAGVPRAGATVLAVMLDAPDDPETDRLCAPADLAAFYGAALQAETTDADGRATLRGFRDVARVHARFGDRCADVWWTDPGASDSRTLRLTPHCEIRVVHADGTPGAGVELRAEGSREGVTDAAGRAFVLRRIDGVRRATVRPVLYGAVPDDLSVSVSGPGPVVVKLPPAGTVEVIAVDATTSSTFGSAKARVDDLVGVPAFFRRRFAHRPVPAAPLRRGRRSFHYVAHGLPVEALVEPYDAARAVGAVRAKGPAATGERVEIRVPIRSPRLMVVGRVVNEEGRPVSGAVIGPASSSESAAIEKDVVAGRDGGFRLRTSLPQDAAPAVISLRVAHARGATVRTLEVPVESNAHGVATLAPVESRAEVFCAGTVTDEEGRPVPYATVIVVAHPPTAPPWNVAYARTDSDGRFAVPAHVAPAEPSMLVLKAQSRYRGSRATTPMRPGARDLRLTVEPQGEVSGSAALPSFMKGADAVARLAITLHGPPARDPSRPGNSEPRVSEFKGGALGDILFRHLTPGKARVELRLEHEASPFLVVDDLEVRAAETLRDPRLQDVDVGAFVTHERVRVFGDAGEPAAGAYVCWRDYMGRWSVARARVPGFVDVVTSRNVVEAFAGAEGLPQVEVRLEANAHVRLRRRAPSTIVARLGPAARAAAGRIDLSVVCERIDGRPVAFATRPSALFDGDGVARFEVLAPGAYRVRAAGGRTGLHPAFVDLASEVFDAPAEGASLELELAVVR